MAYLLKLTLTVGKFIMKYEKNDLFYKKKKKKTQKEIPQSSYQNLSERTFYNL